MPSQLSSLLVRDGLTTPRRLERALMRQVVHGGSLDTVLLELGEVPEDRLTQYLSLATGLPPASKSETDIFDAEAIKHCPEDIAQSYQVAPLSLKDSVLKVLVCEPVNQEALQKLADEVGVAVQPVVGPEYRFHVIFGRVYGHTPRARFIDIAELQYGVTFAATGGAEPIILEAQSAGDTSKIVIDTPLQPPSQEEIAEEASAPAKSQAASGPAPEAAAQEASGADEVDAPELVPKGAPPLSLEETKQALTESKDRDEIFELLLRGLRSVTRYAALLTVQGKSAVGRLSLHDGGFGSDDIESVLIPLDGSSVYGNTFSSGAPFIGPLHSEDPDIDAMSSRLGGEMPASGLVLPISLRGRVVAMAVAHCGEDSRWIGRASMTFTLGTETASAIERLLASKHKKDAATPEPTGDGDDQTSKVDTKKGRKKKKRSKKANAAP